jgi:RHS repeat-associated protein
MKKFLHKSILFTYILLNTNFFTYGITGPADVCVGTNNTYTVSGSSAMTGYTWTIPSGASIISGTGTKSITINFSSGGMGKMLSVTGNGISENYTICSYSIPATVGPIRGRTTVCPGETSTYSLYPNGNATGYRWLPPNGTSIVSQIGSTITLSFQSSFTSGILYGSPVFGPCGPTPYLTLTITAGGIEPGPAGPIAGPSIIYAQNLPQVLTYSVATITNAQTYNWIIPTGANIISQNANTITLNFSTSFTNGVIKVQGMNGPCLPGIMSTLEIATRKASLPPSPPDPNNELPNPYARNLTLKPVGSVQGSVNVGSGSASYTIPIAIPSGTAGMQPSVSIHYNSGAGIGLLGKGWNLSATSAIVRTGNNIYLNGKSEGINFDSNDKYALDGNKLIATNGTYGNDNTEYRTEFETFSKIKAIGVVNNGNGYFTVETKDGKIMEYGKTSDSRIPATGRNDILTWYLNKISDKLGNYIKYNYTTNATNGETILTSIEYTGNDDNALLPLVPYNKIEFIYTSKDDPGVSYIKGSLITQSQILSDIKITYENATVKDYIFKYNSTVNEATRLVEVIEKAANGAEYNSTIITWGNRTASYSYPIVSSNVTPTLLNNNLYGDFNGDGRLDFIEGDYLYLAKSCGYNFTPIYACSGMNTTNQYLVGDFNGDGLDDLLERSYDITSNIYTFTPWFSTGQSFTRTITGEFNFAWDNEFVVGDFNGDGLVDCFVKELYPSDMGKNWSIFSCTGTTHDIFQTLCRGLDKFPTRKINPDQICQKPIYDKNHIILRFISAPCDPIYTDINKAFLDFDGDGKTDMIAADDNGASFYKFDGSHFVKTFTFSDIKDLQNIAGFGNFNNDANVDVLFMKNIFQVLYTTGINGYTSDACHPELEGLKVGDFNGDGKTDILTVKKEADKYNLYVIFNTDNQFNTPVKIASVDNLSFISHVGDFNGDGTDDIYFFDDVRKNNYMIMMDHANDNQFVKYITNGLNQRTEFAFLPITNNTIYTKGSGSIFPVKEYQGSLYVPCSVSTDNGLLGQSSTSFTYAGIKIHRQGRGMLGFTKITTTNNITGIKTEQTSDINPLFYYSFPIKSETKKIDGTLISVANYTNDIKDFTNKRIFPYTKQVMTEDKLTNITATTSYTYDDYGNVLTSNTNQNGEGTVIVTNTYTEGGSWCPAKVDISTVTKTVTGQPANTRKVDYNYNTNGQVTQVINDPDLTKKVTTTYEYLNSFGNISKVTTSATGITSRYVTYTFDNKGRFVNKNTNLLGQYTEIFYDNATGNILSNKDINGLQTSYSYDAFGRPVTTTLPDNNTITTTFHWAESNAPQYAVYFTLLEGSGKTPVKTYFDRLARPLQNINKSFNGTNILTETKYNIKGQIDKISDPYFENGTPEWTTFKYDDLGRNYQVISPAGTTSIAYNGLTVTTTNESAIPKQSSSKTINGLGQLVSATDAGGTITYAYYSTGQPKQITSPGNSITTMLYDEYGNQTQLNEPNSGTTSYTYDSFHQLLTQVKNGLTAKTSTLTYDDLGRLKTLTEPEGVTTYTYDTKTNGIGLLSGITSYNNNSEDYNYDMYGRLSSKTEKITNQNFTETYTYDAYGRISVLQYPSKFAITYHYNSNSYLSEIIRNDDNTMVWRAETMNARGQIEQFKSGNNLITNQTFNYGFVTDIQTGTIQNQQYNWDLATGNLNWRKDVTRSLTENFSYDNLNRLTGITGSTNSNYTFNTNGNIETSTPAGTYTYDAVKPHAVTSVTNPLANFSATEQNVLYTSFDKIKTITEGIKGVTVNYGANKERNKLWFTTNGITNQIRFYSHGNYEKESGTINRELHYISASTGVVAIYEKKSTGNGNQMYYIHKDHLGSINVITNQSGAAVEEMSFDAWGRRRNPTNWTYTGIPTTHIIDRGYTGHEHLDQFGIINMNGRVYDPVVGRFLSPDMVVQAPNFTQSYNRYSYCFNNPLKYTDPTGWFGEAQDKAPWEIDNNWRPMPRTPSIWDEYGPPRWRMDMSIDELLFYTSPARFMPQCREMFAFNQEMAAIQAELDERIKQESQYSNNISLLVQSIQTKEIINIVQDIYSGIGILFEDGYIAFHRNILQNKHKNQGQGAASAVGNFFSDHFYVGAEGEISYGVQLAGMIKKGVGVNINPVSQIVAEGSISNRGHSIDNYSIQNAGSADKVKAMDFGVAWIVGGNYNWNVVNGQMVSQTASLGVYGFGGNLTWDKTGVTNLFLGFELGGKVAVGWGASGSVKIGFTWNFK